MHVSLSGLQAFAWECMSDMHRCKPVHTPINFSTSLPTSAFYVHASNWAHSHMHMHMVECMHMHQALPHCHAKLMLSNAIPETHCSALALALPCLPVVGTAYEHPLLLQLPMLHWTQPSRDSGSALQGRRLKKAAWSCVLTYEQRHFYANCCQKHLKSKIYACKMR